MRYRTSATPQSNEGRTRSGSVPSLPRRTAAPHIFVTMPTASPIPAKLSRLGSQLLLIEGVRRRTAWSRYQWFRRVRRRPISLAPTSAVVSETTIGHNRRGLEVDFGSGRSTTLLRPLSVLAPLQGRLGELDVLSVGPRTEGELLNIVAHGFNATRIRALDIMS